EPGRRARPRGQGHLARPASKIAHGTRRRAIASGVMSEAVDGQGYAVSSLDQMGDGYGFRKIRHAVGVTAFGMNAIVLPPGYETGLHYHEQQEEPYLVHQGQVESRFGD